MEEIIDLVSQQWGYENYQQFITYETGNDGNIKSFMKRAMKEYAKLKCAEQRQLCANNARLFKLKEGNELRDCIINAPEPEL